jgi:hypothetical protein
MDGLELNVQEAGAYQQGQRVFAMHVLLECP